MADSAAQLVETLRLLTILLAVCRSTVLALESEPNVLTTDLTTDLHEMNERLSYEISTLNAKLAALAPPTDRS